MLYYESSRSTTKVGKALFSISAYFRCHTICFSNQKQYQSNSIRLILFLLDKSFYMMCFDVNTLVALRYFGFLMSDISDLSVCNTFDDMLTSVICLLYLNSVLNLCKFNISFSQLDISIYSTSAELRAIIV